MGKQSFFQEGVGKSVVLGIKNRSANAKRFIGEPSGILPLAP